MKRRLDALNRIGRMQALMHDVGRSRLHSLDRQQAEVNEDLKAVFAALEGDIIAYGAQAGLVARRIRTLGIKLDLLAREQDSARRAVLTRRGRSLPSSRSNPLP